MAWEPAVMDLELARPYERLERGHLEQVRGYLGRLALEHPAAAHPWRELHEHALETARALHDATPVTRMRTAVKAAKYLYTVKAALPRWYTWAFRVAAVCTMLPGVPDFGIDEGIYTVILAALLLKHRELLRTVWRAGQLETGGIPPSALTAEARAKSIAAGLVRRGDDAETALDRVRSVT